MEISNESQQGMVVSNSKSTSKRRRGSKSSFARVNERFEHLLNNQVGSKDDKTKRLVSEECINRVDGISSTEYQKALRDAMTKLLFNFPFLMDCNLLGVSPFSASQNVVMFNKLGKVSKEGLVNVFKGKVEMLSDIVYTEGELARAKYDTPVSQATPEQEKELSLFVEKAMQILPKEEKSE